MTSIPTGTPPPESSAADSHAASERRAGLTARLAAAREAYGAEARQGRAGRAVLAQYADEMDDLVRDVSAHVLPGAPTPIAIGATGGYGPRAPCLNPVPDLLF